MRRGAAWRFRRGVRRMVLVAGVLAIGVPGAIDAGIGMLRPIGACRVMRVVDGDTVTLWCAGAGVENARLVGFDAPELFSPQCTAEFLAAQKAKWALRMMLASGDMRAERAGLDRYGRRLVSLYLGGEPLADRMVAGGHARRYGGGVRAGWCGEG